MGTGIVVKWNEDRGYGFISPGDGRPDIFVHRSEIRCEGHRWLVAGESVEFDSTVQNPAKQNREEATGVHPASWREQGTVLEFGQGGRGKIMSEGGELCSLHYSDILSNNPRARRNVEAEELVEFETEPKANGELKAVRVKKLDCRPPLFQWANFHSAEDEWLQNLASKVEPEPWDYGNPSLGPHRVLRQYLVYMFSRLKEEDSCWRDGDDPARIRIQAVSGADGQSYACFNTGLLSRSKEEVFAFFGENRSMNRTTPWWWLAFCTQANGRFSDLFHSPPRPANFFDAPADFFFDREADIKPNYDHIVNRAHRFPASYRHQVTLENAPELLREPLERAKRQVRQNHNTAIPSYYQSKIQLLLPLIFKDGETPGLALTLHKAGGIYIGTTVLERWMAYSHARLIQKPMTSWILPDEDTTA